MKRSLLSGLLFVMVAGCGTSGSSTTTTPRGDHAPADLATLEARIALLEASWEQNAEVLAFLRQVMAQTKAQARAAEEQEHDPSAMFAVDIARDVAAGKVDGPLLAPVTIVKAFDFACPYCQRTSSIMDELVQEYAGKVRVVYMDLVVHPDSATKAHLAACGAAKQGKYKAFKAAAWDKAFQPYAQTRDPSKMGEDNLLAIAKDVGLDTRKLKADMNGPGCQQLIAEDMAELAKFNVNATPSFFVNGTFFAGALPKEGFKALIDEQLEIVERSGAGANYYDQVVMTKGVKQFKSAAD